MGYIKGYKKPPGRKILHISHSKVKLRPNIENSEMPFTSQEKARILSEYHRTRSVTLTQRWVWGHIKSKIYSTPIDSIEDLKIRIRAEINSINQETLQKVWENMKLRLNYIKQQNGGHIENTLN